MLVLTLLPLLLVATGLSWYYLVAAYQEMDRALERRALDQVGQLAKACEFSLFSGNRDELSRLVRSSVSDSDIRVAIVSDRQGREIFRIGQPRLLLQPYQSQASNSNLLARSEETILVIAPVVLQPLAIEDAALGGVNVISSAAARDDIKLGHVALEVSRLSTRARQQSRLLYGLSITGLGLLLAGLLAWRLGRNIVQPIGMLTEAVEKIAAGDLNARVKIETGGEFAVLERGINHMAAELKNSYDTLQEKIRAATAKLSWQASHDPLTGLLNRHGFDAALQQAWDSTQQTDMRHCLLYLDLDQFKLVNDTSGHQAGDELLRQLASAMRQSLRGSDVIARLGGDEFGVLLNECSAPVGEQLGEKLRHLIGDFRFSWNGRVYQVGASIGLVELDRHWPDTAHLMSAADAACYAAKDAGRNKVRLYRRGDEEVERRRGEMEWVGRLKRAMQADHFQLYYQPIVALADSTSEPHYELLLRLHDEESPVLPMAFIPAAERYQLMPMIDRWVIERALAVCVPGMNASLEKPVMVSINLSGASLSDTQFQVFIHKVMRENAAIAPQFCFEITETTAISNLETVLVLIENLKTLGCKFALDDFGSGLSSFAYLHNLAVDYLKIDGAFVRDMARDPVDAAMVEAIAKVARIMGIKTVAEYVEDQATVDALKALGVDYGQGHHFAEAKPLTMLCAELAARV
ncbi:MAG: hypothetical protein B7Y41_08915 [Hydrogenophilales bacterium 28-61-23]|nr:MAG: hypothetical protein B7Y41_08915 [Hydrogenophilales bacterium 28-61-23]